PVDLVDEKNVSLPQVRQGTDEVAGLFKCRAGGRADIHAHLARDELGQGGFAESGWPEEERMVERIATRDCRIDINLKAFLYLRLSDELGETLRAKRKLHDRFFGEFVG